MISDNAKIFVSAAQTVENVLISPEVQHHLAGMKVQVGL